MWLLDLLIPSRRRALKKKREAMKLMWDKEMLDEELTAASVRNRRNARRRRIQEELKDYPCRNLAVHDAAMYYNLLALRESHESSKRGVDNPERSYTMSNNDESTRHSSSVHGDYSSSSSSDSSSSYSSCDSSSSSSSGGGGCD